jgi:FKBP-type peptidyl-prolyl cis-trans isomerase
MPFGKDLNMLRKTPLLVAACLLAAASSCAAEAQLASDDQKTLYAVGFAMSQRLTGFGIESADVELILKGLEDGLLGSDAKVAMETYGPKIEDFLLSKRAVVTSQEKELGQVYRDEVALAPGAVTTESGLIYFEQQAGTGQAPAATDSVKIHYHGTFRDGGVFDSSREAGEPASLKLDGVVPCFSEGIQRMKVGGKSKLVCPPDLAYGDQGFPPVIPPGATLVFEVELLEIVAAQTAAP